MKRIGLFLLSLLVLLVTPVALMAMDHSKMDHSGMGGMQELGECMRDNVHSKAKIKTYGADAVASMANMGMDGTHHFMVFFSDLSGNGVVEGVAAVRVINPDGEKSAPVKLMAMGNGFGSDIVLRDKGEYTLEVGTKLKDGKKRVYEYTYEVQ